MRVDDVASAAPVSADRRASRRFIWLLLLWLVLLLSSLSLLLPPSCEAWAKRAELQIWWFTSWCRFDDAENASADWWWHKATTTSRDDIDDKTVEGMVLLDERSTVSYVRSKSSVSVSSSPSWSSSDSALGSRWHFLHEMKKMPVSPLRKTESSFLYLHAHNLLECQSCLLNPL